LACCFLFTLVVESGIVVLGLFIKPLETALGWSQTRILGASTVLTVASALAAPLAGRLAERHGARKVVFTGALIIGAGFFLLSRTAVLWQFYVGYGLTGVGMTAAGPITLTYVVSNWFERRRGMAVGTMAMGVGVSSIVFAPLVAVYLIPHFGWSNAYLILGAIHLGVFLPLSLLVLRTRPADMGLHADGIASRTEEAAGFGATPAGRSSPAAGVSLRVAVTTAAFWLIGVSLIFNHTHLGVLQTIFPHLQDMGFSASVASSAVGLCGVVTTLGMFFFGWLCDRMSAAGASAIGLGVMALGILMLLTVGPQSPVEVMWLCIGIMGFGVGSWMPTMSMLTSSTFGMAFYAATFGTLSLFASAGAAAGPLIAGYVYDVRHSYVWAFGIIVTMIVLAIPVVLLVRRPHEISEVRE